MDSQTPNLGLRHPQPHQKSGGKEKKPQKITFFKKKVGVKKVGDESEKKSSYAGGGDLKRPKPNLDNRP